MARNKGLASFSANFEPQVASSLDARANVATKAELYLLTTWQANDGLQYTYVGMPVTVAQDGANNGIYILVASDYTLGASWIYVGATSNVGSEGLFHVLTTDWLYDVIDNVYYYDLVHNLNITNAQVVAHFYTTDNSQIFIDTVRVDANTLTLSVPATPDLRTELYTIIEIPQGIGTGSTGTGWRILNPADAGQLAIITNIETSGNWNTSYPTYGGWQWTGTLLGTEVAGDSYFNSTTNIHYFFNGTTWARFDLGAGASQQVIYDFSPLSVEATTGPMLIYIAASDPLNTQIALLDQTYQDGSIYIFQNASGTSARVDCGGTNGLTFLDGTSDTTMLIPVGLNSLRMFVMQGGEFMELVNTSLSSGAAQFVQVFTGPYTKPDTTAALTTYSCESVMDFTVNGTDANGSITVVAAQGGIVTILPASAASLFDNNGNAVLSLTVPQRTTMSIVCDGGNYYAITQAVGSSSKYVLPHNATTDWTLNGSYYDITILAATHGKGSYPTVQCFEETGTTPNRTWSQVQTIVNVLETNAGDVVIKVSQTPDQRYIGRVVIS